MSLVLSRFLYMESVFPVTSTEQSQTAAGSGSSEELMCFGFGHQIGLCGTLQY